MTYPRCRFVDARTGAARRCDDIAGHDGRHSFSSWGVHAGADPDRFYPTPNDLNERTDMAKQQIEKPSPEETEPEEDRSLIEAAAAKYQKYPSDPAEWTPEHDLKVFGEVTRLMARAPYAAQCRMFPYLQGLISPDHHAEKARQEKEWMNARNAVTPPAEGIGLGQIGRHLDETHMNGGTPVRY